MPAPSPMPTKPQFASLAGPTRSASGWANVKWVVLSRLSKRYVVLRACMLELFDDEDCRTPLISVCVCGGSLSTIPSRREVIMKAAGHRVVVQWPNERQFRACIAAFNYANRDINEFYKLVQQRQLGRGRASDVIFAFDVATGVHTAVKVVSKQDTRPTERLFAEREVDIRSSVQHPAVVQTLDIFETPASLYLVMEYMSGGPLHRKMLKHEGEIIKTVPLREADARIITARLFCALRHIHSRGIVHRNVKPDNILLDNTEDSQWPETAKLADLSLACRLDDSEASVGVVGTPDFLAPEATCMVTTPTGQRQVVFGTEVDMWAAGVTLYNMLSGTLPFDAESPSHVLRKVRTASFDFSPPAFAQTSHAVRSLIRALLNPCRRKRLTAAAALQHPWFTGGVPLQPTAQPRPAPRKSKRGVGGGGSKGGGIDPRKKVVIAKFRKVVMAVRAVNRFRTVSESPVEPPSVAPPPLPKLPASKTSRSSAGSAGASSGSGGGGGGPGGALLSRAKSLAISTSQMSTIPSFVSAIDISPRRPRTTSPPVISRVSNSSTVGTRSSASDEHRAPSPGPGWRTKQVEAFARAGSYRREERGNEIPFLVIDKVAGAAGMDPFEERRRIVASASAGNIGVRVLQPPLTPTTPVSHGSDKKWNLRDVWEQRAAQ